MKKFCILIIYCTIYVVTYAQELMMTKMLPPNTAQLIQSGNIPMNLYTGNANVSIPIYHTQQSGVSLSISLNYDTSGIMANALPGWTGHSWQLSTGGCITRITNNYYDEYEMPDNYYGELISFQPNEYKSYFKCPDKLFIDYYNDKLSIDPRYDYSPDIFCFNFMGHYGYFFLDHHKAWRVCSDDNINVIFDITDSSNYIYPFISQFPDKHARDRFQPKTIKGFTLIDDKGNKFYFGGILDNSTDAIEYETDLLRSGDKEKKCGWNARSWYLREIRDYNDISLYKFTYNRGKYLVQIANDYKCTICDKENEININPSTVMGHVLLEPYKLLEVPLLLLNRKSDRYYKSSSNGDFPYNITFSSPIYLNTIETQDDNKIIFEQSVNYISTKDFYKSDYWSKYGLTSLLARYSNTQAYKYPFYYLQSDNAETSKYQLPNDNKEGEPLASAGIAPLSRILLKSGSTVYKAYYFNYTHNDSTRLHLNSICVYDDAVNYNKTVGLVGTYEFKYNDYSKLPNDYLTHSVDHWGYYNGAEKNPDQLFRSQDFKKFLEFKTPSYKNTMYGMLTQIKYPTGGITKLSYELNSFEKYFDSEKNLLNESGITGGLRVSQVVNFEDSTMTKILGKMEYKYKGGELYSTPKYIVANFEPGAEKDNIYISLFSTSSIIPMANLYSPHIGYSTVIEESSEYSRTNIFTNFSDYSDLPPILSTNLGKSPFDKYSSMSYKRGKLLTQITKDKTGKIIEHIDNEYKDVDIDYNYGYAENFTINTHTDIFSTNSKEVVISFAYLLGGIYRIPFSKFELSKTTKRVLCGSSYITDTIYYKMETFSPSLKYDNEKKFIHYPKVRKCIETITCRKADRLKQEYAYEDETLKKMLCFIPNRIFTSYNGQIISGNKTVYKNTYNPYVARPLYNPISYFVYIGDSVNGNIKYKYSFTKLNKIGECTNYFDCINRQFEYDEFGRITKVKTITLPLEGKLPEQDESYIYNDRGLLKQSIDCRNEKVNYIYDSQNRLVEKNNEKKQTVEKYKYHYKSGIR